MKPIQLQNTTPCEECGDTAYLECHNLLDFCLDCCGCDEHSI